jgi:hypothetical protein
MLLEESESNSPQPLLVTVHLPWADEIELAKVVDVEYTVASGPAHSDEPVGIRWAPSLGGIYPAFDGELRVREGDHADSSVLELLGHYTPPFGALGMRFDAAVGHKIAESTVKSLLQGFASGIVARNRISKLHDSLTELNELAKSENRVQVVKACMIVRPALPAPSSEQPTT